jgi:hypothetical protein
VYSKLKRDLNVKHEDDNNGKNYTLKITHCMCENKNKAILDILGETV